MSNKLILIRHGQSVWNKENRFTGLTDVELSDKGINEANNSYELIKKAGIDVHLAFTSNLKRAIDTCKIVTNNTKTIIKSEALNERDYGDLTGKNKEEIALEYGSECVHKWRRGFYDKPPNGENLDEVCKRVSDYYNSTIKCHLNNKDIIISAHGNSIRALFVVLGLFNKEEIEKIEIPTGKPYVITFKYGKIIDHHYICPIKLKGRQILDSRGNPTIEVDVLLDNKLVSRESCPSGASTGSNEAVELRDKEEEYLGKSVRKAVLNVSKFNSSIYLDKDYITDQIKFDKELCRYDGTILKKNIGGNTTTAMSFAAASSGAKLLNKELFQHFDDTFKIIKEYKLPTPMVNILNGGKHAGGKLKIQEFMIMPQNDISFEDKLHNVTTVYHNLGKLLIKKYGISSKNLGDEGGFAPQLNTPEEALIVIEEAIVLSGFIPGKEIFLALDCAASEYYDKDTNKYEIEEGLFLNNIELVDYYKDLVDKHPAMKSIEDPFDEFDYDGWKLFTEKMGERIMVVGDDLYTTNINTVKKGIENKWANSLLLKVNQIGTINEAVEAAKLLFQNNMNVIVSHRSGETMSTLISDLAVGIGAKYIKTGAPARGERVAKYNRLLQIEEFINEM